MKFYILTLFTICNIISCKTNTTENLTEIQEEFSENVCEQIFVEDSLPIMCHKYEQLKKDIVMAIELLDEKDRYETAYNGENNED